MKFLKFIVIIVIPFVLIGTPVLVWGQDQNRGLVNCDGEQATGDLQVCTFQHFLDLIEIVVNYLISIAAVLATVVIVVAGVWLVTAGGNESRRKEAVNMLTKATIGLLIVLAAYLIIQAIIIALASDSTGVGRSLRGIFGN